MNVIWSPQPGPQTAFLKCPVFEIFFGGARGGGKTEAMIGDWISHSFQYGEKSEGLFIRRKLVELKEVISRTHKIFPKLGAKWKEQDKTWVMSNGAILRFAYLENDRDAQTYQGYNNTRLYIEEVCNFPSPEPINLLRATLRSKSGVQIGMRLTGNPSGPGMSWVKARYIDPAKNGMAVISEMMDIENPVTKEIEKRKIDRIFIPSKLSDNPLLIKNDPDYILRLKQSGSAQLVRAWLEGDWEAVEGAYFDEWEKERHVISAELFRDAVARFESAGARFTRFRGFDWGSARPFAVVWLALLPSDMRLDDGKLMPKGSLVVYREWYGAKGINKGLGLTPEGVAQGIFERERGEAVDYGVADPAIFIRNGGPSVGETMAVKRCAWRRGDNKRLPGWQQVRSRLHGVERDDGQLMPTLYVCDTCPDLIRTFPLMQNDPGNPEDLDTDSDDHLMDALRYALMSRPSLRDDGRDKPFINPRANTTNGMTFSQYLGLDKNNFRKGARHG